MTSGKVFLAETRKFYNVSTELFEYFIWLIVHSYLYCSGSCSQRGHNGGGIWPISHYETKVERGHASSEQTQLNRGRGTAEKQLQYKKKWVKNDCHFNLKKENIFKAWRGDVLGAPSNR